jgi:hypothetical protein
VIQTWRLRYNEIRPLSSVDNLTPAEFAAKLQQINAASASAKARYAMWGLRARPIRTSSRKGHSKARVARNLKSKLVR